MWGSSDEAGIWKEANPNDIVVRSSDEDVGVEILLTLVGIGLLLLMRALMLLTVSASTQSKDYPYMNQTWASTFWAICVW